MGFGICLILFIIIPGVVFAKLTSKHKDGYIDDGKQIVCENLMIMHCNVVHDDSSLYAMLNCAICPYKAECKKYTYRHNGKTPIEVLREQGDKQWMKGKEK